MAQSLRTRETSKDDAPAVEAKWPVALTAWATLAMALNIGVERLTYGALLPGMVKDLNLSYTAAGALGTANLTAYLLGTLIAPSLGQSLGIKHLAWVSHLAVALGAVVSAIAGGPYMLGVGRVLLGLGAGSGMVALFVLLLSRTSASKRGTVSAIVWSGIGVAIIVTGATLPYSLEAASNWRIPWIVCAVLAAAVTLYLARLPQASPIAAASATSSATQGERDIGPWAFLFVGYALFGVGYISFATFSGARLAAAHVPLSLVSLSWCALGIAVIVGCVGTAYVLNNAALRPFAFTLTLICGAIGCCIASYPGSSSILASYTSVGLGLSAAPAVITAFVRERSTAHSYSRMFSLASACTGIGQLIGPMLSGASVDYLGPRSVLPLAGAAYIIGTVTALIDMNIFMRRRKKYMAENTGR